MLARFYYLLGVKMSNGKGDKRRPEDAKKFRDNYDRIFGKKKPKKKEKKNK